MLGAHRSLLCAASSHWFLLQAKQAELSASATKKAVQLKASTKQLEKLKKDVAKLGEGACTHAEVDFFLGGQHVTPELLPV